jgi:antitoxin VapB
MTQPRRKQPSITIRSAKAAELLSVLTSDGRSQAQVIEEALERMPRPAGKGDDLQARRARIEAILDRLSQAGLPTMEEFDREEYDEFGNPR